MLKFFRKNNIGEPPWNYNFLVNLEEREYPKYLAKIFNYQTGEKLPLKWNFKTRAWVIDKKRCKTFNQKIQWIKLYGVTDLMRRCTDKVAVRDYVRERIGEEYLKPVLQIIGNCSPSTIGRGRGEGITLAENGVSTYFDQINWEKLPNAFVIKCNHGCKWQYIIKNKEEFLNTPKLVEIVKRQITGWLEQEYCFWNGFELNYKGIKPNILIEPLMRDMINEACQEIHVYCINGTPEFFIKLYGSIKKGLSVYDKNFNQIEDIFDFDEINVKKEADEITKQTYDLSMKLCMDKVRLAKNEMNTEGSNVNDSSERFEDKKLSKDFNFVRVDWMIYQNKIFFAELTFIPYSGFHKFRNEKKCIKLGKLLKI